MTVRDFLKLAGTLKEIDMESEMMVTLEKENGVHQLIKLEPENVLVGGSMLVLNGFIDMEVNS